MSKSFNQKVSGQLEQHGWSIACPTRYAYTDVIATKIFQTAVGKKEATIYYRESSNNETYLSAEYDSQGRNILSTCMVSALPDESITADQFDLFLADIELAVSNSYAMRLHRKTKLVN